MERREATTRPRISAIVLTWNDAERIGDCLRSLEGCVGDVHVVDSGSTDATVSIAEELGAHVVTRPFLDYAEQRNWAQDNLPLAHEWVLHLDADEQLDSELIDWMKRETPKLVDGWEVESVMIKRRVRFLDKEMKFGGINPTYHVRLFNVTAGRCESRKYDQHFVCTGGTTKAHGALIEDNGADVVAWCRKHLRWAELEARELQDGGEEGFRIEGDVSVRLRGSFKGTPPERRRWFRESVYGRMPRILRAWLYLIYRLIFRLGFMDGWQGVVYHTLHGFWFRLVVDSMLLTEERLKRSHDVGC